MPVLYRYVPVRLLEDVRDSLATFTALKATGDSLKAVLDKEIAEVNQLINGPEPKTSERPLDSLDVTLMPDLDKELSLLLGEYTNAGMSDRGIKQALESILTRLAE